LSENVLTPFVAMKLRVRIPAGASVTLRASHRLLHCHWSFNQQKLAPGWCFPGRMLGRYPLQLVWWNTIERTSQQQTMQPGAWAVRLCLQRLQPKETLPGPRLPSVVPKARAGNSNMAELRFGKKEGNNYGFIRWRVVLL